ncbi:MAG: class I SAM-dependent methyltransferase [Bacillota bacterium]
MGLIEFWGAHRQDLYDIMCDSVDPEGLIPARVRFLCPWDGRLVMDVGCGRGDHALLMARDAGAVVAADADPRMVARTARRVASAYLPVCVLCADAADLPLADESLDVIYAFWAYFFGPGAEPGLRECERVLRPGGALCVVQNRGDQLVQITWCSTHVPSGACLRSHSSRMNTNRRAGGTPSFSTKGKQSCYTQLVHAATSWAGICSTILGRGCMSATCSL